MKTWNIIVDKDDCPDLVWGEGKHCGQLIVRYKKGYDINWSKSPECCDKNCKRLEGGIKK